MWPFTKTKTQRAVEQLALAVANSDQRIRELQEFAKQAGEAVDALGDASGKEWDRDKKKWLKKKKSAITKRATSPG